MISLSFVETPNIKKMLSTSVFFGEFCRIPSDPASFLRFPLQGWTSPSRGLHLKRCSKQTNRFGFFVLVVCCCSPNPKYVYIYIALNIHELDQKLVVQIGSFTWEMAGNNQTFNEKEDISGSKKTGLPWGVHSLRAANWCLLGHRTFKKWLFGFPSIFTPKKVQVNHTNCHRVEGILCFHGWTWNIPLNHRKFQVLQMEVLKTYVSCMYGLYKVKPTPITALLGAVPPYLVPGLNVW